MSVPQGAVYGFLGRNGAGKTTTLKMLLGLLRPSAGTAFICGINVATDRISAARKVGALLEAHGFYPNLTGRENLDLTRKQLGLSARETDRVLEVMEMTAADRRRVSEYSLGMRQRLGIARAMLGQPPVLILDEPTNGLDPDGITELRLFLKSLPERSGATVLLSSHLLSEIEQTATHVGIVHRGRLVLEGELSRLKASQQPEIDLRVGDLARAAQVLESKAVLVHRLPERLVLRLRSGDNPDQVVAETARELVQAGIDIFSVSARERSLEGIYRDACSSDPTPKGNERAFS
jgi:ABC-2 type transport system ATP-binding protein